MPISSTTFDFLRKLSRNNNREWFLRHKSEYEHAKADAEKFVNTLITKMNEHDDLETTSAKQSLYRIHNDVRFSSEKIPYNPRFAGYLRRGKPFLRGGYYFWIKPGGCAIGCGFTGPNPDDLRRIREDIDMNSDYWRDILKSKSLVKVFGQMRGDQVKTAPRGYQVDHPSIDLLRFKQYWFERSFKDDEALHHSFVKKVDDSFRAIRPFFDYMSDVLSTNANGEPMR